MYYHGIISHSSLKYDFINMIQEFDIKYCKGHYDMTILSILYSNNTILFELDIRFLYCFTYI